MEEMRDDNAVPSTLWRGVMTHRVKINDLQGKRIQNNEEGGREQNEQSSNSTDENFVTCLPKTSEKKKGQSKTKQELEDKDEIDEKEYNIDNENEVIIITANRYSIRRMSGRVGEGKRKNDNKCEERHLG